MTKKSQPTMSTNVISLDSRRPSHLMRRDSTSGSPGRDRKTPDLWRNPIGLTPDLTTKLLRGLADSHIRRLEVFACGGARVSMHQLLAATGDDDLRILSHFQGALSRRVRRLLDDREKRIHLIGWDYAATQWDADKTRIIDGVCYVADTTQKSLVQYFGGAPNGLR